MSAGNCIDEPHPRIRVKFSGSHPAADGEPVHYMGWRAATHRQAIAMESAASLQMRPSVRDRFDARTAGTKLRQWLRLLLRRPVDALLLPHIDRHPPMVTSDYDDSDDWAGKRWRRALARHRGELPGRREWCGSGDSPEWREPESTSRRTRP